MAFQSIFVVAALVALVLGQAGADPLRERFTNWLATHKPDSAPFSAAEWLERFAVFKANVKLVEELNAAPVGGCRHAHPRPAFMSRTKIVGEVWPMTDARGSQDDADTG